MYPFKFKPVLQERIWGGRNLSKHLNKYIPAGRKIGESWEISAHPNGFSTVANGKFEGKTIPDLIDYFGSELVGHSLEGTVKNFPLLAKLLDAQDKLSIQVHPDDDYAYQFENKQSGKSEMWYVLHAELGAQIVYGFKEGVQKKDVISAIKTGSLEDLLNYVPVHNGDVFYIPAGLVHALGSGLIVAEIQQDSDLTYRVYDYNRVDDSGKTRQLHIDKALEVIDFNIGLTTIKNQVKISKLKGGEKKLLCSCDKFDVEKICVFHEYTQVVDGLKCYLVMVIAGEGVIYYRSGQEKIMLGDSFLIPAGLGDFSIIGQCEVLLTYSVL